MKDVYEKNPQMGDPGSLQPKISETICNMEKLRSEIHKNEVTFPKERLIVVVLQGGTASGNIHLAKFDMQQLTSTVFQRPLVEE